MGLEGEVSPPAVWAPLLFSAGPHTERGFGACDGPLQRTLGDQEGTVFIARSRREAGPGFPSSSAVEDEGPPTED